LIPPLAISHLQYDAADNATSTSSFTEAHCAGIVSSTHRDDQGRAFSAIGRWNLASSFQAWNNGFPQWPPHRAYRVPRGVIARTYKECVHWPKFDPRINATRCKDSSFTQHAPADRLQ
jgi:hypothetical protein